MDYTNMHPLDIEILQKLEAHLACEMDEDERVEVQRTYDQMLYHAEKRASRLSISADVWNSGDSTSEVMRELDWHEHRYERRAVLVDKIAVAVMSLGVVLGTVVCPIMVGLM